MSTLGEDSCAPLRTLRSPVIRMAHRGPTRQPLIVTNGQYLLDDKTLQLENLAGPNEMSEAKLQATAIHARTPNFLVHLLGGDHPLTRQAVRDLFHSFLLSKNNRVRLCFEKWRLVFSSSGYDIEGGSPQSGKLTEFYSLPHASYAEVLFVLHTYYSLIVKLIAAEIVASARGQQSPIDKMASLKGLSDLRIELAALEDEAFWSRMGVENFLEEDVFSWYLHIWDHRIAEVVRRMLDRLVESKSPLTETTQPSRDSLKSLYQGLFPHSVRQSMGEYYTPDWLAQHVLDTAEYDGNPMKRLLDPACGSGTFLVLAIERVHEFCRGNKLAIGHKELAQLIFQNVVGFDLNPLAVLTSRTNYLLAVRNLLSALGHMELPVYLCDSIVLPEEVNGQRRLKTSAGDIFVPTELEKDRSKLREWLYLLQACVVQRRPIEVFLAGSRTLGVPAEKEMRYGELYKRILRLQEEDRKEALTHLKNALAPLYIKPVDYVVGNPPWITWSKVATNYRYRVARAWKKEKIFTQSGWRAKVAAGKTDQSALFVYASFDRFLKDNGILSFVITLSLFKSRAGGEGFRRFACASGKRFAPLIVEDLTGIDVFPGASNLPSVATFRASTQVQYPMKFVVWKPTGGKSFDPDIELAQVLGRVERIVGEAVPVDPQDSMSPWLTLPTTILSAVRKIVGPAAYRARIGVNTGGANSVFWVNLLDALRGDIVRIKNSRNLRRPKIKQVIANVEADVVYPLLRGKDVARWCAKPSGHILLPYDPREPKKAISEGQLKTQYPKAYDYLSQFRGLLKGRREYARWKSEGPFYELYRIGPYTFSKCKVVWQHTGFSGLVRAAVVTSTRNVPIPDQKVILVPFESEDEAHYFCALLNSKITGALLKGYLILDAPPHILDYVGIPRWDPNNEAHASLSRLSRQAHLAAKRNEHVSDIELSIDREASKLWDLTEKDLNLILKFVRG